MPSPTVNSLARPLVAFDSHQSLDQAAPAAGTLSRWFEALSALHQSSADSQAFYQQAAKFVVDPVGLDGAMVLRLVEDSAAESTWQIVASHLSGNNQSLDCDGSLLAELQANPTTLYQPASEFKTEGEPLPSVVLTPLSDETGKLLGAIYGYRILQANSAGSGKNKRRGIRPLEAQLVRLLGETVSAGMIRQQKEAACARRKTLLEQTFTPAVISQIENDPSSLAGQECEVSVLFADVRGFSDLCRRLTTRQAYELLADVMDCLTAAIMQHDGVVIDYYGDGLAAMWNAPVPQDDHPQLACQAGLQMLASLPIATAQWTRRLGQPLRIGIGVHTGLAQVGNVGSRHKLKYGPRGATVNLASRVEGATKRLGVPMLITGATRRRLGNDLISPRFAKTWLQGVTAPIDLYGVLSRSDKTVTLDALYCYEAALESFESGDWQQASKALENTAEVSGLPVDFLRTELQASSQQEPGRRASDRPADAGTIDLRGKQ